MPPGVDLDASGTICVPRVGKQDLEDATRPATAAEILDGEELAAGEEVGNYLIREMIGRGGCGSVYAAEQRSSRQIVAVKVLRLSLASSPHQVRRFVQEARALRLIEHPGIVEVYDTGFLHDGRPYFVMELLEGRSLASILGERGRMSPAEALELLAPVCEMLELAHRAGIVHRDIKASNIMISEDGGERKVRLLDFGLAKLINNDQSASMQTSMGVVLGTLHSMAPEQIIGATIDGRTDIYALGALLHRLLTGRHPFEDIDGQKVARMHLHKPPPQPSQLAPVAPALDAVVQRALDKEPGRRFQSAGTFLAALRDAIVTKSATTECDGEALAILLEGRIAPEAELDESLFTALMAVLDTAERMLASAGMQILVQTTSCILAARLLGDAEIEMAGPAAGSEDGRAGRHIVPSGDALRSVVQVAAEIHRAVAGVLGDDERIHLNVCIHCDRAVARRWGEQIKIAGGEIINLGQWAPRSNLVGVFMTGPTTGDPTSHVPVNL